MSADSLSTRLTLYRDAGRFRGMARRAWQRRWVRILAILAALPFLAYFLLWLIFGMGVASIIFFLLALGLLGGWLAF